MALLRNVIQKYAWGSRTAIPGLLGEMPDGMPQAELWMGAHPKAPSSADIDGVWVPLTDLIDKYPEMVLGEAVSHQYGGKLPFLFKVLAAVEPLSIQTHPDRVQARDGYNKETAAGIALDAFNRNYKDNNPKPECICALTPFWALNGFRKIPEILSCLGRICPNTLSEELVTLGKNQDSQGLKSFFRKIMTKPGDDILMIVNEAAGRSESYKNSDPAFRWITRLRDAYPEDIGVLSPAILNLVCLEPGEAMYLSAGRLHSYLEGVGIELMASSDNVLRGGLTNKHIDIPELLKVLLFEETQVDILKPIQTRPGVKIYQTPAEEFALSEISVGNSVRYESPTIRSAEILLCIRGEARVIELPVNTQIDVFKGMSMIIPASVDRYCIEGNAVFYKASVGISGV